MLTDLGHRGHFGGRAADEDLGEGRQFLGRYMSLDHLKAPSTSDLDHRAAGNAVQETIGQRGVDHPIAHQEDVGARGFGDVAAPVMHQGVGIALLLRGML